MTDNQKRREALEAARPLAVEAHCRYCDPETQDSRLKCKDDVADSAKCIADALLTWDAGAERRGRVAGLRRAREIVSVGQFMREALLHLEDEADALEAEGKEPRV